MSSFWEKAVAEHYETDRLKSEIKKALLNRTTPPVKGFEIRHRGYDCEVILWDVAKSKKAIDANPNSPN